MNILSLFAPFLDIFWVLETYTQIVFVCIICRMRFCCPDGCVTQTCWRLDWCSARAVSSGCCVLSWATVRVTWNSQNTLFLCPSFPRFISLSFRFCRLSAQVVFSGRNERVSDSVPAVRGAPSAGVPASHGLRAQVSTRWLFHRDERPGWFWSPHLVCPAGVWRRVTCCCQLKAVCVCRVCRACTVWWRMVRGWEPCLTCLNTVRLCCPGWVRSCCDRWASHTSTHERCFLVESWI